MRVAGPYALFLGDAHDQLAAKTADGIARWRPENVVGQISLAGCNADVGCAPMSLEEAVAAGARTLVVGVANRGGLIAPGWLSTLHRALELGLDIAAGLHQRLADLPGLAGQAAVLGRQLHDVRQPDRSFAVGTGLPRPGRRCLTVGTDCSVGKMFTALALEKELRARGCKADFRATGQTGILIAGDGVSIDAVVADFISGATEWLCPANDDDHWDLIEGQGSLFHPSYAGVSLGLLHGAQPQALVLCTEVGRPHMRGLAHVPLPSLAACLRFNEECARLTAPTAKVIGIAANTSRLDSSAASRWLAETADQLGLPAVDPLRGGVAPLVKELLS